MRKPFTGNALRALMFSTLYSINSYATAVAPRPAHDITCPPEQLTSHPCITGRTGVPLLLERV